MVASKIRRIDKWKSLGNITCNDWKKAAEKLGLPITAPSGGSSHLAIRKPTEPIDYSPDGLISTIYEGMHKQINQIVFRRLMEHGFSEDEIWIALGKLKKKHTKR